MTVTRHQFGGSLADWTFRFTGDTVMRASSTLTLGIATIGPAGRVVT